MEEKFVLHVKDFVVNFNYQKKTDKETTEQSYAEVGALFEKMTKSGGYYYQGSFTLDGKTKYFIKVSKNVNRVDGRNHPHFCVWLVTKIGEEYQPDQRVGSLWINSQLPCLMTGNIDLADDKFKIAICEVSTDIPNVPRYKLLWELENEIKVDHPKDIEYKKPPKDSDLPY